MENICSITKERVPGHRWVTSPSPLLRDHTGNSLLLLWKDELEVCVCFLTTQFISLYYNDRWKDGVRPTNPFQANCWVTFLKLFQAPWKAFLGPPPFSAQLDST